MAVANELKQQLLRKIDAVESIQKCYPSEKVSPDGWPAAFLRTTDLEGSFASSAEDSRVYGYRCTIAFPTGSDWVPEAERERLDYAEYVLNTCLDQTIAAVDEDFELDGVPVLFVEACDATWGYITVESGEAEAVSITLKIYTEQVVVHN